MKALRILAAALGRSIGGVSVTVDPSAETAYTDGRRVVLPLLPDVGGEDLEDLLLGLAAHEAFHIRFTFGGKTAEPPAGVRVTPFIKRLQNGLEDPRIEALGMKQYRGIPRYLHKLIDYGIRSEWFSDAPKCREHPGNLVLFGLLYQFRAHFLGQHALDIAAKNWGEAAIKQFGGELWAQIVSIGEAAVHASSVDAPDGPWIAAQKISDLLGDAAKNYPNKKQGKAAKKAMEAQEGELRHTDVSDMAGGSLAAEGKNGSWQMESTTTRQQVAGIPDDVKLEAGRFYRKIAGPLESKLWATSQEETYPARTGTCGVVTTALHRVGTSGSVFARRIEGDSRSIAVKLLIDKSGSMDYSDSCPESRNFLATAGALALTRTFAGLGIEYSVSWFNGKFTQGRPFSSAPLKGSEGWSYSCSGGTCMEGGMTHAGLELQSHQADRKLLIVLTDGSVQEESVAAIDDALMRQGIEVRYVLIGKLDGFGFAKGRVGSSDDVGKSMIEAFSGFAI